MFGKKQKEKKIISSDLSDKYSAFGKGAIDPQSIRTMAKDLEKIEEGVTPEKSKKKEVQQEDSFVSQKEETSPFFTHLPKPKEEVLDFQNKEKEIQKETLIFDDKEMVRETARKDAVLLTQDKEGKDASPASPQASASGNPQKQDNDLERERVFKEVIQKNTLPKEEVSSPTPTPTPTPASMAISPKSEEQNFYSKEDLSIQKERPSFQEISRKNNTPLQQKEGLWKKTASQNFSQETGVREKKDEKETQVSLDETQNGRNSAFKKETSFQKNPSLPGKMRENRNVREDSRGEKEKTLVHGETRESVVIPFPKQQREGQSPYEKEAFSETVKKDEESLLASQGSKNDSKERTQKEQKIRKQQAEAFPESKQKKEKEIENEKVSYGPSLLQKILFSFSIVVFIVILSGGGYYFWDTYYRDKTPLPPVEPPIEIIPLEEILPVEPSISYDAYTINTVEIGGEEASFAEMIESIREELEDSLEGEVFGFTFVDADTQESVDITQTFPRLVESLGKIVDISSWYIVASVEEVGVRFGIVVSIDDVARTRNNMRNSGENEGAMLIASLYPKEVIFPSNYIFQNGVYEATSIRYINIDEMGLYSLDYATLENKLIIGTHKDSIRALLDTIDQLEKEDAIVNEVVEMDGPIEP